LRNSGLRENQTDQPDVLHYCPIPADEGEWYESA
jgi:hypothetical protein